MKLILTKEVTGLGKAGDVVNVKDGYARNYLLPRGNAILWSKGGEGQIEGIRRARKAREVRDLSHAQEIKQKLEANDVTVKVKVGSTGSLFGSVTDKDLVAAIKSATDKLSSLSQEMGAAMYTANPEGAEQASENPTSDVEDAEIVDEA